MLSVNCPVCGQKVTDAKTECELCTVCPKCKTVFDAQVKEMCIAYKVLTPTKDQSAMHSAEVLPIWWTI